VNTASLKSVYMQIQCWELALANVCAKSVWRVQIIDHSQVILKVTHLNSKRCQNLISNTTNYSYNYFISDYKIVWLAESCLRVVNSQRIDFSFSNSKA